MTIYDCVQIGSLTYHAPKHRDHAGYGVTCCGRPISPDAPWGHAAEAEDPNWCKTCLRIVEAPT